MRLDNNGFSGKLPAALGKLARLTELELERALEEAAAVAAYWSKGKTAKKVSVVYTLVKYVTKPRGGAPGQALLKREKSLVVEPGLLPEDNIVA